MSSQRQISSFFTPLGKSSSSSSKASSTPIAESSKAAQAPKQNGNKSTTKSTRTTRQKAKTVETHISDAGDDNDDDEKEDEDNNRGNSSFSKRLRAFSVQGSDKPQDADYATPAPKRARIENPIAEDDEEKETEISPPEEPFPHKKAKSPSKQSAKGIIANKFTFSSSQPPDGSTQAEEEEISPEESLRKQKNHERFVRKLGRPGTFDVLRRAENGGEEGDEEFDDEDEEPERAPEPKKGSKAAAKRGSKLTPLEQQVVDIKLKHMDTVLVVEVGLITAGHKVGVVRQLETAALKAAGDNRNAPFIRKLTNLYTKGTYIDDIDGVDDHDAIGAGSGGAASTGYLLCITEKLGGGTGADEKVKVGILAVQPSTGDIIFDEFDDGFMRSEIETRLLHNFYAEKLKSEEGTLPQDLLDIVTQLPDLVTICLSAMITHLTAYGLEHVFDLTKYFKSFSARSHMLLNGNTLSSLEIYRNQTDFSEKGSLFWTLDHTSTRFGRRLLRKWVGRPLLDRGHLEERINAVEEMLTSTSERTQLLKSLLTGVRYDLEKGLIRIYYGKATRPEVFNILKALQKIATTFNAVDSPEKCGYESPLVNEAMASLPKILESVTEFMDKFDHKAASKDDKYSFFKEVDEYDFILDLKMAIKGVEYDLQDHLKEAAKAVKQKQLEYVTVAGVDYLIQISNVNLKNVPASWVKISGTKKVSRFHTPEVLKFLRERDQRKETLANECDRAFREFMGQIAAQYQQYRDAVQSLATLDCLVSLATVAQKPGYAKPVLTDGIGLKVKQGRHPMVEQLLLDAYVPNDIELGEDHKRSLLITGPNMGGKSSYVRQVALIAIMAQIGSYVPAESAELGLLDAVFTRMGAFDNMMTGESTFMVELSETSDILKQATPRSLVILDELGRGTSTHDGVAIAYSVLDYMITSIKAMTLFVTHYPILAQMEKAYPKEVVNAHMRFEEAKDGSEDITFLYQIAEGIAHRSYGLNVAKLANVPQAVLDSECCICPFSNLARGG
ncbi:hypothetical protein ABW20_dc0102216 [Dactylellina cionopaga]|nr:hypothetical protein ABW20_dc0102216 [Dactylellina cionopaga]